MKKNKLLAVYDEYNKALIRPDLSLTIQAMYTVKNHGCRLVMEEEEEKERDGKNE